MACRVPPTSHYPLLNYQIKKFVSVVFSYIISMGLFFLEMSFGHCSYSRFFLQLTSLALVTAPVCQRVEQLLLVLQNLECWWRTWWLQWEERVYHLTWDYADAFTQNNFVSTVWWLHFLSTHHRIWENHLGWIWFWCKAIRNISIWPGRGV